MKARQPMLGFSGNPSSVSIRGHSLWLLYKMRLLRRRLGSKPRFPRKSANFLETGLIVTRLGAFAVGGHAPGLFRHPCFPAGMRTKRVQNAYKNANVTFLLTRYQPLTISRPQSVRIFMNPRTLNRHSRAALNTDPRMADDFRLNAESQEPNPGLDAFCKFGECRPVAQRTCGAGVRKRQIVGCVKGRHSEILRGQHSPHSVF
jgi:hypothetical protein